MHGITGFGYPIVGTAVVAGFYPLKVAVAMVVPCIVMNVVMLRSGAGFWRNVVEYGRAFLPLFVSSFVGGLIGVKLLLVFPEPALKMFLGVTLLFYVATQYSRFRIRFGSGKGTMRGFGFVAGSVGGVAVSQSLV